MHICNNRRLFSDFETPKLGSVKTGGGPVLPQGRGSIVVRFFTNYKEGIAQYSTITLKEVLYIPSFPLNIVSGDRLYASGGTLIKQKLYTASGKVIALLDF